MSGRVASETYLLGLERDAAALGDRARVLFSGLSEEQIGWSSGSGVWSIGECLEHLVDTNRLYLQAISQRLDATPSGGARAGEFRGGRLAGWFIDTIGPGNRRRAKAPKVFTRSLVEAGAGSLERFLATLVNFDESTRRARGVDLTRTSIPSPVSGLIRFRLGDAFRVVIEHAKRHIDQAERILHHPEFPGGGA